MNPTAEGISEKLTLLSNEQLVRVERFVEALQDHTTGSLVRASSALSEGSFAAVWNNSEDDVYDDL